MNSNTSSFRIALVQMDPKREQLDANREAILSHIETAADAGANLVVFPECALSGYVFNSLDEARPSAESVPGVTTEVVAEVCRRRNVYAVVGLLESEGDAIYNSAFVVGPQGLVANYRKCHLPILGIDRYVTPGAEIKVLDLGFVKVGVLICYDLRFPEPTRLLTLQGADILLLPTNWPEGAESSPEFLTRARAWENRIYVAACNRVGEENGARFIGRSQIVAPNAKFLAEADGESETILYADIEPAQSRQKRFVVKEGFFEFDTIGHRRPELYEGLL